METYKRGSRWWIRFSHRGRQYREPGGLDGRGARTKAEAAERLRQRVAQLAAGTFSGQTGERRTVNDVVDSYLDGLQRRGRKSVQSSRSHLEKIRAAFGDDRIGDVTPARLRRYVADRQKEGYAPAGINRPLQLFRAALREARREDPGVPVPAFPMLPERNTRQGFVEPADLQPILDELPEPYRDAVEWLYLSAWRRSEAVGLAWDRIDLREGVARLQDTKSGKPRLIPLVGRLREIIERRRAARTPGCAFVFEDRGARLWRIGKVWREATIRAGKPELLMHDLRRSGIRNLIRAGTSESVAMAVSGHTTRSVFDRYNVSSTRDVADALAKTEEYLQRERNRPSTNLAQRTPRKKAAPRKRAPL